MNIEAILKEVPLFSLLSAESLTDLVNLGQTLPFQSDQIVCEEGDVTNAMYVILDGRVNVFKKDEEGNQVDITMLQSGDFFGEMALLDSEPRSASVVCVEPCRLFMLDRPAFMNLLLNTNTQAVSLSIFTALVKRVRATTERVFVEELTQRMVKAEMEAERHRSLAQMVAGVAHELNTPLGVVNTAVDMIAKRAHSENLNLPLSDEKAAEQVLGEMKEAADLAIRNIARAHKLVQNFKKISVSQLIDTLETVTLPSLVEDIIDLFTINARLAKLSINVNNDLPSDQRIWVGYPGYLTQILTNLLFNIQHHAYSNGSGGIIEIGLRADESRDTAVFILTVQDFGKGIPPENLTQIFTPFFTTGRGQGGTGLGLAIVQNIVTDALKGTIDVVSEPDKGTLFTLTFPQIITA